MSTKKVIVSLKGDRIKIDILDCSITQAQEIRDELNKLFTSDNPALLKAEIEMWKRRAASHGCNTMEGDDDCG